MSTTVGGRLKLYLFREEDSERVAFTADAGGSRLPPIGSVWRLSGDMNLGDAVSLAKGSNAFDMVKGVERDGYFIWPPLARTDHVPCIGANDL
jgi:hypothetical protein